LRRKDRKITDRKMKKKLIEIETSSNGLMGLACNRKKQFFCQSFFCPPFPSFLSFIVFQP